MPTSITKKVTTFGDDHETRIAALEVLDLPDFPWMDPVAWGSTGQGLVVNATGDGLEWASIGGGGVVTFESLSVKSKSSK